jgi:NDP-sugar pyrophosphorylase family protein
VSGIQPARRRCLESLDILVLAGGLGTRLQPVLGDVPKLLAPIAGRPYLAYLIDWFRSGGARRIVFGLGHRASAIIDCLRRQPPNDLEIVTLVEPQPLGTAGAIRFARTELRSDPVLAVNGDSFVDADLCAFVDYHRAARALGSIVCAELDDASRYGRVQLDPRGRITRFIEKDASFRGPALVSAGLYLLSAKLLNDIAAGTAISLEHDVFERLPPGSLGAPESLSLADRVLGAAQPRDRI